MKQNLRSFLRRSAATALSVIQIAVLCVSGVTLSVPAASAAIVQTVGYQGTLKNSSGSFLTGTYSFIFRIYDAETAGTLLWSETQSSVTVDGGAFIVKLGSSTPFPTTLDFNQALFLSTEVNGDGEMSPRVTINSVPYAYTAGGVSSSDTAPTSTVAGGRMYYNTVDGSLQYYDDTLSTWRALGTSTATAETLQSVTNRGAATTNAIQFAGGVSTGAFTVSSSLMVAGTSTLQSLTFTNATGNNIFATNGNFSNLFVSSLTPTNLIWVNATGTNTTSTNLYATNGTVTNAAFTNATSSNLFTTNATIGSLTLTNPLTVTGITWVNATGTNTTSTNLFATNLFATNATLATAAVTNGSVTSLSFTSATGASFLATSGTITSLNAPTLNSSSATVTSLSFTNGTSTSWFGFNTASGSSLFVNGQSVCLANGTNCPASSASNFQSVTNAGNTTTNAIQFAGGTSTRPFAVTNNFTVTGTLTIAGSSSLQGVTLTNATGTNVTTTNLFATNATVANLSVTGNTSFTNITWTNATGVNTTSTNSFATNLFATMLGATSATIAALDIGNATATGLLAFNSASGSSLFVGGQQVCLANGTNCPSGTAQNFQTVTNAGNTTTNAIQFAGGTSTANFLPSVDAVLSLGTSTLRWNGNFATLAANSLSFLSATGTNFLATSGTITSLGFTSATGVNITATNLSAVGATFTNVTSTNGSITNLTGTNATFTNLTVTGNAPVSFANLTWTNATGTNTTSTNLFATNFGAANGAVTNGTITSLSFTSATGTNLLATNGTITTLNASTLISTNANVGSLTSSNLIWTNATGTNTTSTNLFASNLGATNATISSLNFANGTSTGFFNFNSASGSALFVQGQAVCLANGTNCPSGTSPNFQTVTNAGNTTTNAIVFNGGTSTGIFDTAGLVVDGGAGGVGDFAGFPTKLLVIQPDGNSWSSVFQNLNADALHPTSTAQWAYYVADDGTLQVYSTTEGIGSHQFLSYITPEQIAAFGSSDPGGIYVPEAGMTISPFASNVNDLGLPNASWRNIYASGTASTFYGANFTQTTTTNATTTNLFASLFNFGSASGSSLIVNGQSVCLANGTNCPSGTTPNFQTVTNSGNTTTNAIQFAGGTSTAGFLPSVDALLSLGSASLRWNGNFANVTSTNVTTTNQFVTNLNAVAASITTANVTNGAVTSLSFTSATGTNFLATSGTITNLTATNATLQNLTVTGNAPVSFTNLTWTNATGTNTTSTNLFATNLFFTNSNGTNSTTTNSFSTNEIVTNSTSTNLFVTNGAMSNGTITSLTFTSATGTNFLATSGTITTLNAPTLVSSNATVGSLTSSNLIWTNATGTNTTSTNLFATNVGATNAVISSLVFGNGTSTGTFNFNSASGPSLLVNGQTVCLANGTNCPSGTTPNFQTVTNAGNTTTNAIQFAGGTSTAAFAIQGALTVTASSSFQNITFADATGSTLTITGTTPSSFANLTWMNATGTYVTSSNLFVSDYARLPSNTQINNTAVCLSDGTNCPSGTTPNFQTVTNSGNTTTNAIVFNGGTSTGAFTVTNNFTVTGTLTVTGSASLQDVTATNATATNLAVSNRVTTSLIPGADAVLSLGSASLRWNGNFANVTSTSVTTTNLFATSLNAAAASITTATVANGTITSLSFTSATGTNFLATSGTITNLTATNATATNQNATRLTFTNGTGTSFVSTNLTATNATFTNFAVTGNAPVSFTNLTWTNATGTNTTSTNLFATNFGATNGVVTNGTITSLSFTSATGTNFLATSGTITTLNAPTLISANATISGGTINNIAIGGTTPSTAIFTNTTSTNSFATNALATNVLFTNGTSTGFFNFNSASGSSLFVGGQQVCLANGTNCPVAAETDTLLSVTNRGSVATATVTLFGGLTTSNLTVTGTTSLQDTTLTNATATNIAVSGRVMTDLVPVTDAMLALGSSSLRWNGNFANVTSTSATSTNFFATNGGISVLTVTTATIQNLAVNGTTPSSFANLTWTNATGTNTVSTNLFATSFSAASEVIVNSAITSLSFTSATGTNFLATSGTITNLTSTNVAITGGSINNTSIGSTIPSTGVFTNTTSTNSFATNAFATNAQFTNGTSTGFFNFNSASGSSLFVGGQQVCLANGSNCPAAAEADTLLSVTNRGSVATATVTLFGGLTTADLTATGTASLQAVTFTNGTGSNLSVTNYASTSRLGVDGMLVVGGGNVASVGNSIAQFGGSTNTYLQLNVQNKSNGNAASGDLVVTADNGTDSSYYVDLGINSSGYNQSAFSIGSANDAYLYTNSRNLTIGTASGGAVIFHTSGTTAADERMRITEAGNVGIGMTAPTFTLEVAGTASTTNLLVGGQSVCLANGTNCIVTPNFWSFDATTDTLRPATATSDMLIGGATQATAAFSFLTSNTSSRFYAGAFGSSTNIVLGGPSSTISNTAFQLDGGDLFVTGSIGSASSVYTNGSFAAGTQTLLGNGFLTKTTGDFTASTTGNFYIQPGVGNVRIGGNSAPGVPLEVGAGTHGSTIAGSYDIAINSAGRAAFGLVDSTDGLGEILMGFNSSIESLLVGTVSNHALFFQTNHVISMNVGTNGFVGIGMGTATPRSRLEILGITSSTEMSSGRFLPHRTNTFDLGSASRSWANIYASGTATLLNVTSTNVTSTGLLSFNVASGSSLFVQGQAVCLADGTNCSIASAKSVSSTAATGLNGTETELLVVTTTLSFVTSTVLISADLRAINNAVLAGSTITARIRRGVCTTGAQVGIDRLVEVAISESEDLSLSFIDFPATTTATSYRLCAIGAGGTPQAGARSMIVEVVKSGVDIAEVYTSLDPTLGPGEVVMIDPSAPGRVKRTEDASSHPIGVISTQPGQVLADPNMAEGMPVLLALAGRVPVKASTENGEIQPGDALAPASVPGYVMKATQAGMTVGRALSSFTPDVEGSSQGQVLLFIQSGYFFPMDEGTSMSQLNGSGSTPASQLSQSAEKNIIVEDSLFEGNVAVKGHLDVGEDVAGQARLLSGDTEVHVTFTYPYGIAPIVTITPTDFVDSMYRVTNMTTEGFTIQLNMAQSSDKIFNWQAVGSPDGKVFVSDGTVSRLDGQNVTIPPPVQEASSSESASQQNPEPEPTEPVAEEASEPEQTPEDTPPSPPEGQSQVPVE